MRRSFAIAVCSLAACAPAPAVLIAQLRDAAPAAKSARVRIDAECSAVAKASPACSVLQLCLAQLGKVGHECSGAIVTGATASSDDYTKAARRCTDASSVAFVLCGAADIHMGNSGGNR